MFRNSLITSKRAGGRTSNQLLDYLIRYQGGACEVLAYVRAGSQARKRVFLHLFFARSSRNLHSFYAGNSQIGAFFGARGDKAPHVVLVRLEVYKRVRCGGADGFVGRVATPSQEHHNRNA